MRTIRVSGGTPLRGEVRIAGAKNAALKMMAAALLTEEEVLLSNVPRISDVKVMSGLLQTLNVQAEWCGPHTLRIFAGDLRPARFGIEVAAKIRASFLVLAPLLARCGTASVPNPGGDRIGHRPVDRLVEGLRGFGVNLEYDEAYYNAECPRLAGCEYTFIKNSHTGTEHQLLAAVLAEGRSVIHNAAQEPEVDDLIAMLNSMGARISRPAPRTLVIEGVQRLYGTHHTVMPDRIEAGTFATIAAATDGDIFLDGANPVHMAPLLEKLREAGVGVETSTEGVRVRRDGDLTAVNVTTRPHPGFMTDWQAPFVVLLTQARGESVVHETIFPNRLGYTDQLNEMGADIELFNPAPPEWGYNWNEADDLPTYRHAARIRGCTPLTARDLVIPDLRAGATLIIAALCADGTSHISGVHWVERGYEHFIDRLRLLGGQIEESFPAEVPA
ncbi:MAG: UDP-N-acetylglucosamine 1-carboxyvinyltransferase [Chloroflexota bacterium]|nr:UDP-N-acetylglucosamine 1-carboxyvinyltransferase [Chloroflexota bacterium]